MHFFSKESRSTHFACCYAIALLKLHKYQSKDKSTLKENVGLLLDDKCVQAQSPC